MLAINQSNWHEHDLNVSDSRKIIFADFSKEISCLNKLWTAESEIRIFETVFADKNKWGRITVYGHHIYKRANEHERNKKKHFGTFRKIVDKILELFYLALLRIEMRKLNLKILFFFVYKKVVFAPQLSGRREERTPWHHRHLNFSVAFNNYFCAI